MSKDVYAVSTPVYDLLNASSRPGQVATPERLTPLVHVGSGPVPDIGAGSGLNMVFVLERLSRTRVCALEPSTAVRALVLMKIAVHPEWFDQVTIRPEAFDAAPLPNAINTTILLGVFGHSSPDERVVLFAALATRLPEDGAILMDLQPPCRPTRVESYEIVSTRTDDLTYSGLVEEWPFNGECIQWKVTCRTPNGDRVLAKGTTEYLFHHPDPGVIWTELRATGLSLNQIEDTTFYLIAKD